MQDLVLIKKVGKRFTPNGTQRNIGLYRCGCGTTFKTDTANVTSKRTKSCGCLTPNRTKHGMSGTTSHQRWEDMKQRCRPGFTSADRYHDRGIGYPDKWKKFEGFYADMGDCPEGLELDRIDNDKGYSKDNCRWATRSDQLRNRTETNKRGFGTIQNTHYVKSRGKWVAYTIHEGKRKHIGIFATELEAGKAYNAFAKIHGYPERELYG